MDNATRIELRGARLVHEEETKGGVNVKLGEPDPRGERIKRELRREGHVQKGDEWAWRGDEQHNCKNLNHIQKGDGRRRGVRGFWVGIALESGG